MNGQQLIEDLTLAWYQTKHASDRMILMSPLAWQMIQSLFMSMAAYENDLQQNGMHITFRGIPMIKTNARFPEGFKIVTEVIHK